MSAVRRPRKKKRSRPETDMAWRQAVPCPVGPRRACVPDASACTPTGRAMLTIMAAFAQLERDTMIERTRAGLAVLSAPVGGRRAGNQWGCRTTGLMASPRPIPRAPRSQAPCQRLSRARRAQRSICPRYPNCGQDAATFEAGPRVSRDRCARRSLHNRRHAA
jgi:hypothetical protein